MIDLETLLLYKKIESQSFLGSEDLSDFLPYMGMVATLLNGVKPFEQIVNISSKAPCKIWWKKNWSSGLREEIESIEDWIDSPTLYIGRVQFQC